MISFVCCQHVYGKFRCGICPTILYEWSNGAVPTAMARRARLKCDDNSHGACMSPSTAQCQMQRRKKRKKGLNALVIKKRLLAIWRGRVVIELNKVLGDGVASKVGGACSCRPGTPGDLKGPWEPNEGTLYL